MSWPKIIEQRLTEIEMDLVQINEKLVGIETKIDSQLEVPARQPEFMRVTVEDLEAIKGVGETTAAEIMELIESK